MYRDPMIQEYAKRGIIMPAQRVMDHDNREKCLRAMAADAAMQTPWNAAVPTEFTYFLDPRTFIVPIAAKVAREIAPIVLMGKFTDAYARFGFHENVGKVGPYSDFSDTPKSYANHTWPVAENYQMQTNINYGLLEQELLAEAKVDYAGNLQRSAYLNIEKAQNKYWLLGIANMNIYGLLNDPNLPPAVVATQNWTDTTVDPHLIAADFNKMVQDLMVRNPGLVGPLSNFILGVSPAVASGLLNSSTYNQSAEKIIKGSTPNVKIVIVPELAAINVGGQAMLWVDSLDEQPIVELGSSLLFEGLAIVQKSSTNWIQKCRAATYGAIYFFQSGVSRMTGVEG